MAFKHEDVIQAHWDNLVAEKAMADRDYEAARQNEDASGVMDAGNRLLDANRKLRELDDIAANFVRSQQRPQQSNKYGLSEDEIAIARGLASGDKTLSNDDRDRIYSENRQRYRQARRDGSYRDDQGRVTR